MERLRTTTPVERNDGYAAGFADGYAAALADVERDSDRAAEIIARATSARPARRRRRHLHAVE